MRTIRFLCLGGAVALGLAGCGSDGGGGNLGGPASVSPAEPIIYAEFTPRPDPVVAESFSRYGQGIAPDAKSELDAEALAYGLCVPPLPFSLSNPPDWVGERAAYVHTAIEEETTLREQVLGVGMIGMIVIDTTDEAAAREEAERLDLTLRNDPGFDTTDCPSDYGAEVIDGRFVVGAEEAVAQAREAAEGESLAENEDLHVFERPTGTTFASGFFHAPPAIDAAEEALPGAPRSEGPFGVLGVGPLGSSAGPLGQIVSGFGSNPDEPVALTLEADSNGISIEQDYELLEDTEAGPPTPLLEEVPESAYVVFGYAGWGEAVVETYLDLFRDLLRELSESPEDASDEEVASELGFEPEAAAQALGDLVVYATEKSPDRAPDRQVVALIEVEDRGAVDEALEAIEGRARQRPELEVEEIADSGFTFRLPSLGNRLSVYLGADRLVIATFGGVRGFLPPEAEALDAIANGLDFGPSFAEKPVPPALRGFEVTRYFDVARIGSLLEVFAPGEFDPKAVDALASWLGQVAVGTRVDGGRSVNRLFFPMPPRYSGPPKGTFPPPPPEPSRGAPL